MDVLEKILNNWKRRKLPLLAKINVIKSLGLSNLIFTVSAVPNPENFSDQENKITFNFIWNNKKAKIEKNAIIGERENGGLGMIDFSLMNKAFKYVWIKRFSVNENSAWTVIPNKATSHLGGITFLSTCNCSHSDLNLQELPLFYERMLQYWLELKDAQGNTMSCPKEAILWNNKDIRIPNKTIFLLSWFDKGVSVQESSSIRI